MNASWTALACLVLLATVHGAANTTSPTPKPPASPVPRVSPTTSPNPPASNGTSPSPVPNNNGTNGTSPSPKPAHSPSPLPSPSPPPSFPCAKNTTVDFYVRRPETWVIIDVPVCDGYSWYLTDKEGNVALEKYHGTYKEKDSSQFRLTAIDDNPEDRFFRTPQEAAAAIELTKGFLNDTKNWQVSNKTNILTLTDPKDGKVVAYHTNVAVKDKDATVAVIQGLAKKATDYTVGPTNTSPTPTPSGSPSPGSGLKKVYDLKLWELIAIGAGALLVGIILTACMCRTCCRPSDHSDESRHLLRA